MKDLTKNSTRWRRPVWRVGGLLLGAGATLLLGGCQTAPKAAFEPVVPRFYLESRSPAYAGQTVTLPVSKTEIAIDSRPVFSETDITGVELVHVDLGLCLLFQMTPVAARDLYRLTATNVGRHLVLSLNGAWVGARLIDKPISDGRLMTFVELPDKDLGPIVINMNKTVAKVQAALKKGRRK